MATITKTIGSDPSRDFATIQSFLDWVPTDLVAAGFCYTGEIYNDSEFTAATGQFNVNGKTTDSTHFITLKCAANQSFSTHPNRVNNPLWYNQAFGVAVKSSTANAVLGRVNTPYTVIDGLQLWATSGGGQAMVASGAGVVVKNCILISTPASAYSASGSYFTAGATVVNCLIVSNIGNAGSGVALSGGTLINCTIVKPESMKAASSSIGVYFNYNTCVVKNCAIFGFLGTDQSPNSFSASDYNASEYTQAPGGSAASHNLVSQVYADQFVNTNNDFRLKSTSTLINKGINLGASYSAVDIYGSPRLNLWDIGASEFPTPATTVTISGPSMGKNQTASTNFTVSVNGSITTALTVTPNDGGKGGTFNPASVTLSVGNLPNATFTYTPAVTGNISIGTTNNGTLANPTPLTFSSLVAATKVTLVAPSTIPRAGVQSDNFTATLDGFVSGPVKVIPNDNGDGGSFNPPFVSLDNNNFSATFTYVGASGGTKNITATNDGSLTVNTVQIIEKPPIVLTPTPSTSSLVVKSIGAGKDFTTVSDFFKFISSFDLTANQQSVLGEIYDTSVVIASTDSPQPKNPTGDWNVVLQPVPGLSANVLDRGWGGDYGTEGVELTVGSQFLVSKGISFRDLKFNVTTNGMIVLGSSGSGPGTYPMLQRCRVKSTSTKTAVVTGQYTSPGVMYDNLFILDDTSTGDMLYSQNWTEMRRNTFVRRGSASGKCVVIGTGQGGQSKNILINNAFINAGDTPVTNITLIPDASVTNNYTDNAMAVAKTGFTTVLAGSGTNLVRNVLNDYRPDDAGGLIGNASQAAIDVPDLFGISRGGSPDVGAIQGSVVNVLPKVVISSQDVNAQTVAVQFTTKYGPQSGTAVLVPDATNPNGAVQQGPIAVSLTQDAGSVTFPNVPAGNYQIPVIRLNNASGYNRTQTGGEVVNIIPISAIVVAAENPATLGNAPNVTINAKGFDNSTLSIGGAVDNQGDANCTIDAYLDPQNGGVSIGPIRANITGKKWGVQFPTIAPGSFKVRLVANANGKPAVTVNSDVYRVVKLNASIALPMPSQ